MYEAFYGLRERPFDLSPNPRFLFLSNGHRAALTHLKYGLTGRPGLTVLTGEAGTGKTTLVMAALRSLDGQKAQIVHVSNPTLTRSEFYQYLASGFSFTQAAGKSKAQFLRELEEAVATCVKRSLVMALIVDEAQSLPHELLEEIRLLTNTESQGHALTVILVGQPELADRLNEGSLRQLKQRIALRCELAPLDLKETAAYVAARVRVAGGDVESLFTRDAIQTIHAASVGIPRTISVICDNALVNGFATDRRPVGQDLVLEVCRDFHVGGAAPQTVTARPPEPPAPREPWPTAAVAPAPPVRMPEGERTDSPREPRDPREPLFGGFAKRRRFSFFQS